MSLKHNTIVKIIQMRGLGYTHQEIANTLDVSSKTIQNHLSKLKKQSIKSVKEGELDTFFLQTILGVPPNFVSIIANIAKSKKMKAEINKRKTQSYDLG